MAQPMIQRPEDAVAIANPVGTETTYRVRGEATDGRVLALEIVAAPGAGPPLHTHATEDECVLVLEGDVRFRLGDEVDAAPAGSFVYIAPRVAHTWQNVGDEPARMLVVFTPAGMERFFDGLAKLGAPRADAFARVAAEAGMDVTGPPLAESHPL